MIENSNTLIAEMAQYLNGDNLWAVSGTPLGKNGILDLLGLFAFLKVPFDQSIFNNPSFRLELSKILYRNTKENVKNEITLPPQTRTDYILHLGSVERHRYDSLHEDLTTFNTQVNILIKTRLESIYPTLQTITETNLKQKIRSLILQLRQTCCHPLIGSSNIVDLGSEFKSIDQVLVKMHLQSQVHLLSLEKSYYGNVILKCQVLEQKNLHLDAIKKYKTHLNAIESTISKISSSDFEAPVLTSWRILHHQYIFFIACDHHVLKNNRESDEYYTKADSLRKNILENSTIRLSSSTLKFKTLINKNNIELFDKRVNNTSSFTKIHGGNGMYFPDFRNLTGGITTFEIFNQLHDFCNRLDDHWDQLDKLRSEIIRILVFEESSDTPTGQEYEESAKLQEQGAILQDLYFLGLDGRHCLLNGISNGRALISMRNWSKEHVKISKTLDSFIADYLPNDEKTVLPCLKVLIAKLKRLSLLDALPGIESAMCKDALIALSSEYDRQFEKLLILDG